MLVLTDTSTPDNCLKARGMRICILSAFEDLMLRDTGSAVRIYNMGKRLANNGHEVHVVIPSCQNWTRYVDGISVHGISGFLPSVCLRFLGKLLGIMKYTSLLLYDFLFVSRGIRIVLSCDLVQIEQPAISGLLPFLAKVFGKPLVADCHDAFQALRIGHTGTVRMLLETFLERISYELADTVLAVSQKEKIMLSSYGVTQDKIVVIPNGVDTDQFKPLSDMTRVSEHYESKVDSTVVFVGNMEYLPNQEAVSLIATSIAPKVFEKIGNVRFLIVGRGSAKLNLPSQHNLIFAGTVGNISETLATSDVAIAPLLHGSGTRLKILEYFACGLPVVSTSAGVEGLDVDDGLNVLIEDDMNKFAERVVELLENRSAARKLAANARNVASEKYDWKTIIERTEKIYETAIQTTRN